VKRYSVFCLLLARLCQCFFAKGSCIPPDRWTKIEIIVIILKKICKEQNGLVSVFHCALLKECDVVVHLLAFFGD